MRLIAHLSDLHFGREDSAAIEALVAALSAARPHLVVVSGDLTQRARRREFARARDFLARLPQPQLVVPGNHDVPLYDLVSRWLAPLKRYRHYISGDLEPFFADDEIAVVGINTARSNTFKNGRISEDQIAASARRLGACGPDVARIVVTHHPFDAVAPGGDTGSIARAQIAISAFARAQVDMVLSGHLHRSEIADSAARYDPVARSALLIQAGTATSTRQRGEANAFNLVRVAAARVGVDSLAFDARSAAFNVIASRQFERRGDVWRAEPAVAERPS